jgi:hypothetical protein
MIWSMLMLRLATLLLVVIALADAAFGADRLMPPDSKRVARPNLPAGLLRRHYNYRTTIIYRASPPASYVEPEPAPLISPFVWTTPLLPGSSTLPGYYGRPFDYEQRAYYGGQYGNGYEGYFYRLPYACGVIGYC